ncbi:MAG: GNAT family N-acetyltransferase [Gammaproteobacteria bacterium]|nr:GNAT family N-acetyltransferase [Gammaproteobacteria bacterium]
MELIPSPELSETVALLERFDLPTSDLTPELLKTFISARAADSLLGVVGYEPYERIGLLRSLAVLPTTQCLGLGARLVERIERLAHENGVESLYLLTTDADRYFEKRGYASIEREDVPEVIRTTAQFSSLCPGSATVMVKSLHTTKID